MMKKKDYLKKEHNKRKKKKLDNLDERTVKKVREKKSYA